MERGKLRLAAILASFREISPEGFPGLRKQYHRGNSRATLSGRFLGSYLRRFKMSEPTHEIVTANGVAAALFAAMIGAGLALYLKGRDYDPVAEAQRIARRALGIEG